MLGAMDPSKAAAVMANMDPGDAKNLLMAMASHALDARRGVRERRVLSGQWIDEDWLHAWRLENDRRVAEAVAQRGQALVLGKVDLHHRHIKGTSRAAVSVHQEGTEGRL